MKKKVASRERSPCLRVSASQAASSTPMAPRQAKSDRDGSSSDALENKLSSRFESDKLAGSAGR